MGATGRAHRSAAWSLLILLTVVFAPLLCRLGTDPGAGGAHAAPAYGGTAAHGTAVAHGAKAGALAAPKAPAHTPATPDTPVAPYGSDGPRAAAAQHGADLLLPPPKRCSQQRVPGQGESAPTPDTHRGELLAHAAAGPAPYACHPPANRVRPRPPTGSAPAADPCALLPVLRI